MKTLIIMLFTLGSAGLAIGEDTKVTLSGVHLCCKGCVKGVAKAVDKSGGKASCDAKAGTVVISGDKESVTKALEAVAKAGFYGKSDNEDLSIACQGGAKDEKVKSLTLSGAHLCCGKCVKAVAKAVNATDGASAHTAKKANRTPPYYKEIQRRAAAGFLEGLATRMDATAEPDEFVEQVMESVSGNEPPPPPKARRRAARPRGRRRRAPRGTGWPPPAGG